MGWACGVYGWGEGVYRVLMGKPEGRRPPGRPRRRRVDNIRIDLQVVGCEYMDWIGLAQDKDRCRTLVSAVMKLRVPWNAGNFLTSCKPVSFSRRTLHHGVSKSVSKYVMINFNVILIFILITFMFQLLVIIWNINKSGKGVIYWAKFRLDWTRYRQNKITTHVHVTLYRDRVVLSSRSTVDYNLLNWQSCSSEKKVEILRRI